MYRPTQHQSGKKDSEVFLSGIRSECAGGTEGSMSTSALVSTAFRTVASAVRSEQVVGMFLSTVPLAERMFLYNVAMTAWAMVPERGLRERRDTECRPQGN
jgi:hypothetical protein